MKDTTGIRRKYKFRKSPSSSYPADPPAIPSSIESLFLRSDPELLSQAASRFEDQIVTSQTIYKPGLLTFARLTFRGTRWQIHSERDVIKVVSFPSLSQMPEWETNLVPHWENKNTRSAPEPPCIYQVDGSFNFSVERFDTLQEEFVQFLMTTEIFELYYNPYLKILRGLDESEESFSDRCLEQIRKECEQEVRTLDEGILMQQERLKERLDREVRERSEDQMDAQISLVNDPAVLLMKEQAASLERTREAKRQEFEENLSDLSKQQEKDFLRLSRSDIEVIRRALVWLPYTEFVIQEDDRRRLELVQSF